MTYFKELCQQFSGRTAKKKKNTKHFSQGGRPPSRESKTESRNADHGTKGADVITAHFKAPLSVCLETEENNETPHFGYLGRQPRIEQTHLFSSHSWSSDHSNVTFSAKETGGRGLFYCANPHVLAGTWLQTPVRISGRRMEIFRT
jgi:hypothetical protein